MIYDILERKMLHRFYLEPIALVGGLFVVIYDSKRGKYIGEGPGIELTEEDTKVGAKFFQGSREAYWWLMSRYGDRFNVNKKMISRFDIVPIYDNDVPVLRVFDYERGIFIDDERGTRMGSVANKIMWEAWQKVKEEEERKRRDKLELESGVW